MIVLRRAEFRTAAWKNGGGVTHEIIRVPPDGDFRWRMSVAQIERSGPFSDFTGYSRTMALLAGNGLKLQCAGQAERILASPGDWIQFDGALAVHCELLNGACTDLNLMVANDAGAVVAHVRPVDQPVILRAMPEETLVVFTIQGRVVLEDSSGNREVLSPWDAAVIAAADGGVTCRGESRDKPARPAAHAAAHAFIARF